MTRYTATQVAFQRGQYSPLDGTPVKMPTFLFVIKNAHGETMCTVGVEKPQQVEFILKALNEMDDRAKAEIARLFDVPEGLLGESNDGLHKHVEAKKVARKPQTTPQEGADAPVPVKRKRPRSLAVKKASKPSEGRTGGLVPDWDRVIRPGYWAHQPLHTAGSKFNKWFEHDFAAVTDSSRNGWNDTVAKLLNEDGHRQTDEFYVRKNASFYPLLMWVQQFASVRKLFFDRFVSAEVSVNDLSDVVRAAILRDQGAEHTIVPSVVNVTEGQIVDTAMIHLAMDMLSSYDSVYDFTAPTYDEKWFQRMQKRLNQRTPGAATTFLHETPVDSVGKFVGTYGVRHYDAIGLFESLLDDDVHNSEAISVDVSNHYTITMTEESVFTLPDVPKDGVMGAEILKKIQEAFVMPDGWTRNPNATRVDLNPYGNIPGPRPDSFVRAQPSPATHWVDKDGKVRELLETATKSKDPEMVREARELAEKLKGKGLVVPKTFLGMVEDYDASKKKWWQR